MLHGHRLILGVLVLAAFPLQRVVAQYNYPYGVGYAGGGFGGFSGTVDGDIARGMGAFAAGAGTYNYETAVANQINAQTIGGINQYLWLSQQEANRREHEILARRQAKVNAAQTTAQAIGTRIRDNPTEADIDSGAALNAILDQISNPKVMSGSNLRFANAKIDAKLIRDIPFRDGTDAITLTLSQLTDDKSWPAPLRDSKFDAERRAYIKAVADALEEDKNGDLSPASVARVRQTISALYRRVGQTIPITRQPDHLQAMNYLKGLAGFSKMLEKANVEQVLAELAKIDQTTVGNLIAFMHSYNLRFGAAETPASRNAYQKLYPIMVATREKLIGKPVDVAPPATGTAAPPAPGAPTDIFHGIDAKHLHPAPVPDTNPHAGEAVPKP
jgi:hypothetical protein